MGGKKKDVPTVSMTRVYHIATSYTEEKERERESMCTSWPRSHHISQRNTDSATTTHTWKKAEPSDTLQEKRINNDSNQGFSSSTVNPSTPRAASSVDNVSPEHHSENPAELGRRITLMGCLLAPPAKRKIACSAAPLAGNATTSEHNQNKQG